MGWCYCKSVTPYSLELSHGVDENKGDWVRVVGQEPKQKTKTKEDGPARAAAEWECLPYT